MKRVPRCIVILVWAATAVAAGTADESRTVPLDQIWSLNSPDTKNIRDLEPKADPNIPFEELAKRLNVLKASKVLHRLPKEGEKAGTAFVVIGNSGEALKNAADVFTGKSKRLQQVPSNSELFLVFYSRLCGRYVHIKSIDVSSREINLTFQFVAHPTMEMKSQFALIPLGKLSAGNYRVNVKQADPIDIRGRSVAAIDDPFRYVSEPFEFEVLRE